MKCDRCEKVIDNDETGVFDWGKQEGGHIACFTEPITHEEAMDIAKHHQKLSGRWIESGPDTDDGGSG